MFIRTKTNTQEFESIKENYLKANYQESLDAIEAMVFTLRAFSDNEAQQQLIELHLMRLECIKKLANLNFVGFWGMILETRRFIKATASATAKQTSHIDSFYHIYKDLKPKADYLYNHALYIFDSLNGQTNVTSIANVFESSIDSLKEALRIYYEYSMTENIDEAYMTMARLAKEVADWLIMDTKGKQAVDYLKLAEEYYQFSIEQYTKRYLAAPSELYIGCLSVNKTLSQIDEAHQDEYNKTIKNYVTNLQLHKLLKNQQRLVKKKNQNLQYCHLS